MKTNDLQQFLKQAHFCILEANNKDLMYSEYRNARTWVRIEYMWLNHINNTMRDYLVQKLKDYKKQALKNFY
jgi:hypothetical protein